MTPDQRREARAAEYRRLASAAAALAEASPLAHVREKHEAAAAQWTALAVLDEQSVQQWREQAERAAQNPLGMPQ